MLFPAKTSIWFKPQDGKTLIFLPNKPSSTSKPWEYIHNPIIPTVVPESDSFTVFQLALVSASPSSKVLFSGLPLHVYQVIFYLTKSKTSELKTALWPLTFALLTYLLEGCVHSGKGWGTGVRVNRENPPSMWETGVRSLGWEDPLEKGTATHSSVLAWKIPWTV